MMRIQRAWSIIGLVSLVVVASGCGYALVGRGSTLPEDIRRIGVPTFQNLSTVPELDRLITEAVTAEFSSRRRFVTVPETTGVDAVLTGSIRSVTVAASAFTTNTVQATTSSIVVVVSVEFKLTKTAKVYWSSEALRETDDFNVTAGVAANDLAALFAQDRNAFDRIAKKFAKSLVSSILDAF